MPRAAMPCCVPPDGAPLVAVLAAGSARRFGGGKLDAMLAGKRVGQWVLDAVGSAGLAPGIIVVGQDMPQFACDSGWRLVTNPKALDGLGTSIAAAASQALAQGKPLLVLLADMPLVTPDHIGGLVRAGKSAATAWPQGRAGVPALIGMSLLPQAAALAGDAGAGILLSGDTSVARVDADPALLIDVDEAADLARAEDLLSQRG